MSRFPEYETQKGFRFMIDCKLFVPAIQDKIITIVKQVGGSSVSKVIPSVEDFEGAPFPVLLVFGIPFDSSKAQQIQLAVGQCDKSLSCRFINLIEPTDAVLPEIREIEQASSSDVLLNFRVKCHLGNMRLTTQGALLLRKPQASTCVTGFRQCSTTLERSNQCNVRDTQAALSFTASQALYYTSGGGCCRQTLTPHNSEFSHAERRYDRADHMFQTEEDWTQTPSAASVVLKDRFWHPDSSWTLREATPQYLPSMPLVAMGYVLTTTILMEDIGVLHRIYIEDFATAPQNIDLGNIYALQEHRFADDNTVEIESVLQPVQSAHISGFMPTVRSAPVESAPATRALGEVDANGDRGHLGAGLSLTHRKLQSNSSSLCGAEN